jgi:hypothetical protein
MVGDDSDHGSGSVQYSGLWTLVSSHFIHTAIAPPYGGFLAGTHRGTRPSFTQLYATRARLAATRREISKTGQLTNGQLELIMDASSKAIRTGLQPLFEHIKDI